jgi:hypothetical protein
MNKFIKDTQLFILEDDNENESDEQELEITVESKNVNKTLSKFMVNSAAHQDDNADR